MTFFDISNILQGNIENNKANLSFNARYLIIPHKTKGKEI